MDGSLLGNMAGFFYLAAFQVAGILLGVRLLRKESIAARVLLGSVFGSVCLMWFPVLFALFMGFNRTAHFLALGLMLIITVVGNVCGVSNLFGDKSGEERVKSTFKEHAYLLVVLPVFLFFAGLLWTHTIPYAADGSMHTGQATNGDMNMHLSFITSIANQGTFPPEYSMLPGTKLSYPFLCDSVSSSIYLFGSGLRFAYILPMLVAVLQFLTGVLMLGRALLKSRRKAMLAWAFFVFNGGFGIFYFLKGITKDVTVFTRIFTEFYQTPTNYLDKNIRWANILVDMLLPQRATLFGWSVLIPAIFLLYRAMESKKKSYFVLVAVLAGALPMIHTHSFLAMGCICAMWLIYSMRTELHPEWRNRESKIELWVLFAFFLVMCSLDVLRKQVEIPASVYLGIGLFVVGLVVILCLVFTVRGIRAHGKNSLIVNWGILLCVVLVLALPQLITWTFSQAQGEQFLRGHFNWANLTDTYLTFYAKNMGIVWILGIIALIFTRAKNYFMVAPTFFIWTLVELMLFQPNEYDNNKLLYIAYLFLCMFVADYVIEICRKLNKKKVNIILVTVILFISSISAVLTMGREAVSDYQLYSSDEVKMCKYIEKNTEPEDVILTDTRYNNGVVSLTGRNIVCGASSFLYYHGVDYTTAEEDVQKMYTNPADTELFDAYGVEYVYIGNSERYDYSIVSEEAFLENFELVHQEGDVSLYERKNR